MHGLHSARWRKVHRLAFTGSLYETKSKAGLCTFLHLVLWIPCTSTLISAIKTTSSPHGQDSPNNSSKNSFKNPKQQQKGTFGNPTKESSQHIPRNQMKRQVKIQLAHTVFFFKQPIFQETFTPVKPADSPSHPSAGSNTSWSPTTTTPTQSIPNP